MERTIAGGGANTYFLVFNLYDHLHMIFEEASAHFVPNTCPEIPVESIHCLWVLVWPAYIKPSKTDSRRKPSTDYIINPTLDHSTFILEYFRDGNCQRLKT